jgi:hypothetical protein
LNKGKAARNEAENEIRGNFRPRSIKGRKNRKRPWFSGFSRQKRTKYDIIYLQKKKSQEALYG